MSVEQVDAFDPTAGTGRRAAAGVGGVVAAIAFGFATVGIAAIATIAALVAWAVARRKANKLTRGASWLIAVGAVATALAVGLALVAVRMPAGTFGSIQLAIDSSASKPPPPPPEWLRRITPAATQAQSRAADQIVRTRAFGIWMTVVSVALGVGAIAGIAGTLGWGAGVLLIYAFSGRWLPSAPPVGPPAPSRAPGRPLA